MRTSRKNYEKAVSLEENESENYSSSLGRQLRENKPNTKLIMLCLEFNKSNKQNACYINLFKKINLSQSQNY